MEDGSVRIDDRLSIPADEIVFRAVRSSGPGGQHVNTSATKVELTWNVRESAALTDELRERLLERLANRLDQRGVLRLAEGRRRSQLRNREEVTRRFAALLAKAMTVPRKRKATRPPASAGEKRLREKKHRSETKRRRGSVKEDE